MYFAPFSVTLAEAPSPPYEIDASAYVREKTF